MGSLNGIEQALGKGPRRTPWHGWMGGPLPSADRLGEVEPVEFEDKHCVCHDIEGFNTWTQLGHELRVVRSVETRTGRPQARRAPKTAPQSHCEADACRKAALVLDIQALPDLIAESLPAKLDKIRYLGA